MNTIEKSTETAKVETVVSENVETAKVVGLMKNLSVTPMLLNVTGLIVKRNVKVIKPFAANKNGELTDSIKQSWNSLGINPLVIAMYQNKAAETALSGLISDEIKADTVAKLKVETFEKIRYTTEAGITMFLSCEDETAKFAGLTGVQSMFAEIRTLIGNGYSDTQLSEYCVEAYEKSQQK